MTPVVRVTYVVRNFPQASQTYIRSEIEAVVDRYDVSVVTTGTPKAPYRPDGACRCAMPCSARRAASNRKWPSSNDW